MQNNTGPYTIYPLGDNALTIDFGNCIDEAVNRKVTALFAALRQNPLPGLVEAVPAYSSLTIYYDVPALKKTAAPGQTAYERARALAADWLRLSITVINKEPRLVRIPVCYEGEFAPDLPALAARNGITAEEAVRLHTAPSYHVYMLGFLPGFAYMGTVDERISTPRRPHPVPVAAGSVGIAGKQTGIYPLDAPGGWNIIGRTPLKLFDANGGEPGLLQAGDRVAFYSIGRDLFHQMLSAE